MLEFHSFSLLHFGALAGVSTLIVLLVGAGRAWRGSERQQWLERVTAAAILLLRAGVLGWSLLPPHFQLTDAIPLQICDLVAFASAFALLTPRRWLSSIAYFWGLALSVQGLVQPDLVGGPASLEFWFFWLHHTLIVGVAIYLVSVREFRPNGRDLRFAAGVGLAYVAIVFVIDFRLDLNYGYLGRGMPSQPTLLDWLGPWPQRVPIIAALGVLVMWLLLLPWTVRRASAAARPPSRSPDRPDLR